MALPLPAAFAGRRVLVTGDTGFKGSWLCAWLHRLGAQVYGYALPPRTAEDHFHAIGLASRIQHQDGDVRDAQALSQWVGQVRPEFVFHLAAQAVVRASYADPKTTFDVNVGGTVNLLEAVRGCPEVRALLLVSTDKAYRPQAAGHALRESDPLGGDDPYGASKAAAELAFQAWVRAFLAGREGFGAAVARAGNTVGGGDWGEHRLVPDCIRALRAGDEIVLRHPGYTRSWLHVMDVIHGYLLLAAAIAEGRVAPGSAWNFGTGAGRSVGDVARSVAAGWGGGQIVDRGDPNAPHESPHLLLASDRARETLGWEPRWDFDRAIAEATAWYRRAQAGEVPKGLTDAQIEAFQRRA